MNLTRRRVLQGMGLIGAATVANPLISSRAAFATTPTWSGNILVVLSLRGGFDGLSAVPPVGEADYFTKRPTIAVPKSKAVNIGDRTFGLHPALAPLLPLWKAGTMAAVHAVGTPDTSRSHFQATQTLEQAAPGSSIRTGWLDRVMGVVGTGSTFEGVHLGAGTPGPLLSGTVQCLAAQELSDLGLASNSWMASKVTTAITSLNTGTSLVGSSTALSTLGAMSTVSQIVKSDVTPKNKASYPSGDLGSAFADAARLIRANVGLQALTIDYGEWDFHSALGAAGGGAFSDMATPLASSLAAFAQDLGTLFSKVTVVTVSEFGRRVAENGSGGVDHGHGNAMLLLGGGLKAAKVYGTWPTLADADLDQGDLAGTTDYRNVMADALVRRCGVTEAKIPTVFPGLTRASTGAFA